MICKGHFDTQAEFSVRNKGASTSEAIEGQLWPCVFNFHCNIYYKTQKTEYHKYIHVNHAQTGSWGLLTYYDFS